MTWVQHHSQSEQYASAADVARMERDFARARQLYRCAAEQEELALSALEQRQTRILGIIAVSAVALWYKAGSYDRAQKLALHWLGTNLLPPFAIDQLQELLTEITRIEKLLAAVEEWQASVSVSSADRELLVKAVREWQASASKAA